MQCCLLQHAWWTWHELRTGIAAHGKPARPMHDATLNRDQLAVSPCAQPVYDAAVDEAVFLSRELC